MTARKGMRGYLRPIFAAQGQEVCVHKGHSKAAARNLMSNTLSVVTYRLVPIHTPNGRRYQMFARLHDPVEDMTYYTWFNQVRPYSHEISDDEFESYIDEDAMADYNDGLTNHRKTKTNRRLS